MGVSYVALPKSQWGITKKFLQVQEQEETCKRVKLDVRQNTWLDDTSIPSVH